MEFKKYMHVERFGNDEVQGIELGECFIFPKLDGSNGSIWLGNDGKIKAGSRNREVDLDNDNAGFCKWVNDSSNIFESFFKDYSNLTLYGEWLVKHSLNTYRDDSWRKFYVFDVYDNINEKYIEYNIYKTILDNFGINYIPPLCIIKNATYDNLLTELKNNTYLIKEGCGQGEGIVIKNYQYQNRFGRTVWAKIVTNEFKEKHNREMGPTVKIAKQMTEQAIVDEYVTSSLVEKNYAKIVNEMQGWNSKYIPRLFGVIWYDLINEEIWNILKKMKNPTINFKTLNTVTILKIKEVKPELF